MYQSNIRTALILGYPFLKEVKAKINYEKYIIKTTEGEILLINLPEGLPNSNQWFINNIEVSIPEMNSTDEETLEKVLKEAEVDEINKEKLKELLLKYGDLWIGNPRGNTNLETHKIKVKTDRAIRQKPRRFAPEQQKIIYEEIDKMIKD